MSHYPDQGCFRGYLLNIRSAFKTTILRNCCVGGRGVVLYILIRSYICSFIFLTLKLQFIGQLKWLGAGLLFAILWASASTATKLALEVAQPLVIAQLRFAVAGILMLILAHLIFRKPLPFKSFWIPAIVYGLLNITIYLGCYVIAMQYVTAGVGALAIATNPVFISFLSVIFLRKKLSAHIILALALGCVGVIIASWPLLQAATVTMGGLLLLLFSMVSYSAGAIYFASKNWNGTSLLVINGWQTFLGGLMLLPVTLWFYHSGQNHYNPVFWINTLWLALAVSIVAIQLWLWLLQTNTVKAGLWLFLCPVFGLLIAALLVNEWLSYYTYIGLACVIAGLLLTEKLKKPAKSI